MTEKPAMRPLGSKSAYLCAIAFGVVLWLGTAAASGRREAWDSSLYWTVAYPLSIAVAGALGYLAPQRPWRWGLTLMLAQAVTLAAASSSFGLLPLGLIMFGVLAVPPMLVARLTAGLRRGRGAFPEA
jgi:peptidoglycan/LPS O-acetylase OafA/YrhL